jgi:hypothetical protein
LIHIKGFNIDMNKVIKEWSVDHSRSSGNLNSYITLLSLALLMSACATTPQAVNNVEERAQARWDAELSRDYDTAYSYYSPGYRSSTSRVDFEVALRLRRIRISTAEVVESSCEANACTVQTRVGYKIASPVPGIDEWDSKRLIEERWVRTKDEWWFLPEE